MVFLLRFLGRSSLTVMIFREPELTKKNSLCLSTRRLYEENIWAQFWGEKSAGNVPVNTIFIALLKKG